MKTLVKETLAKRLAIFALALAAIVGVCAFALSGTQNDAWAEGETILATWEGVSTDGSTRTESNVGNVGMKVIEPSPDETLWQAEITSANVQIPPSVLKLTTNDGAELYAYFNRTLDPGGNNAQVSIENSEGVTGFKSAVLYQPAPAPQTVTVTFNLSGHGAFPEGTVLNEDGTATIEAVDGAVTSPAPTDADYDFNGWLTEDGAPFDGTAATSMTVFAQWTPKEKVTVTFESEFGTAPEAQTVNKGQVVKLPDLGTDGDYTFEGWIEKGSEGTDPFIGEYTAEEDVTFTAVWRTPSTPATEMVDVIFDMNGHGDNATKQTEKGKPIDISALIDDPAADGYTFKGWTYDKEGKQAFDPKKNADQDTTLYAQWEKKAEPEPDTPDKPSDNPADKPGNGSNASKPAETTPTDFTIVISKTDAKTGKTLSGAEFTLTDKAGNVVDSWTTDGSSKTFTLDRGTSYVLTETKAPTGYNREKAININFSTDDGKAAVKIDQGGRAVALPVNGGGNAALNVKDLSGAALQGTSTTAPKTGDNQNMPLASLCFGAAALVAGCIAATAYRKRQAL